jgi:hypothetical protein
MRLPIKDDGVRPAGSKLTCFYCGEAKGAPHKSDCVIPQRTVVLEMTIQYVASVPAYWDQAQIEFHRNDSSSCSDNEVRLIAHQVEAFNEDRCTCKRTQFRFVREATQQDMDEMGFQSEPCQQKTN